MEPLVTTIVGGLLMFGLDRLRDNAKRAESAVPAPPPIPRDVVASCTNVRDAIQHFDYDIAQKTPGHLRSLSVQLDTAPQSAQIQHARVWRIVPLQMGLPNAAEFLEEAWKSGETVLASLSLILVRTGRPEWPAIFVVGRNIEALAGRGASVAVLALPPEAKPEPKQEPKPEPVKPAEPRTEVVAQVKPNGVSKLQPPTAPPVVIDAPPQDE